MPRVRRLSVTPLKGSALHHPSSARLVAGGVAEDRRFFLVDADGRMLSAARCGALLHVRATFHPDDQTLELSFPDGRAVRDAVRSGDPVTTTFYGRPETGVRVRGPFSAALSSFLGRPVEVLDARASGVAQDAEQLTVVSAASIDELARLAEVGEGIDTRRFRMTFELDDCAPFEEDTWEGRSARIGGARVEMLGPVPRCLVTTLGPDTGEKDLPVLRFLARHRDRVPGGLPLGIYARVLDAGTVSVGDRVVLE